MPLSEVKIGNLGMKHMINKREIQIREFVAADYESAVDFWSTVEGITLNESDSKDAIVAFLDRNPGLSAIATDTAREVVGTVLCGHNGRSGSLYHLAVAAELRGQGLGRSLVEFCFSRLAEAKIPRCKIFVYTDNEVGNRFWLNSGWNDPTTWKVMQKRVSMSGMPSSTSC
jgi:N-acetylglutamate synthase